MIAAIILFATLSMQWVAIGSLGNFSVKLPYLALLLVILYAFTGPRKLTNSLLVVRRNAFWIVPFALYLLLIGLIQLGSPATNSAPRQALYLIGSIALAGSLAATPHLARTFRLGAALGLAGLIVAVEILARSIGLSWFRAISEFANGNFTFVTYSFFRDVFNAVDPTGDPRGASAKNEVAVGVLVLGLLFRSATRKPSRDITGMACMALVLGLLLLLNTRSVLIAAGFSLLLAMIIGAASRPQGSIPLLLVKAAGAMALVVLAVGVSLPADAVSGALSDRFAFADNSTAARLEQYRAALDRIELHPFAGNGYFEVGGHVIHNLFLSAWVQGGLAAFLLVVTFYGGLLMSWLMFLWRAIKRPSAWVLPIAPEWLAPLPLMPLLRVWSSGDGGNMYIGEWIAIACFFGCCLANELRSRGVARVARQYIREAPQAPRVGLAHSGVR